MISRVNDKWVQTHGDYRLHVGERFLPALPQPKRPLHRLPLCLLSMCGGRIESDHDGLWWQCGTCQRVSGYVPRECWPCPYCDGTGDVHRADGEWLGECDCRDSGIEARRGETAQPARSRSDESPGSAKPKSPKTSPNGG